VNACPDFVRAAAYWKEQFRADSTTFVKPVSIAARRFCKAFVLLMMLLSGCSPIRRNIASLASKLAACL